MDRPKPNARHPLPLLLLMLLFSAPLAGCHHMPGEPTIIDVDARYTDLDNRSVAVVVSTSDYVEFNHPDARPTLAREISRRIKVNVPGVVVTDPGEVLQWQDDNPYWATRPPSALIRQLGVDRLVLVELGTYRVYEPGNRHVLRGNITASVHVVEAEAADPDRYGASFSKSVVYPLESDTKIGYVGSKGQEIEVVTQAWFCEETAGLFFDHQLRR